MHKCCKSGFLSRFKCNTLTESIKVQYTTKDSASKQQQNQGQREQITTKNQGQREQRTTTNQGQREQTTTAKNGTSENKLKTNDGDFCGGEAKKK